MNKIELKEYWIYQGIKRRCSNKNFKSYNNYGGRGIKICKCIDSFDKFFNSIGKRPTEKHSIDRIDNDGNYCIKNLKWSNRLEQNLNRRNNKKESGLPKGVYIDKKNYASKIMINYKYIHLGNFESIEEAHQEYLTYYFLIYGVYPPELY